VLRKTRKHLILIQDGASYHKSVAIKEKEIHLHHFPTFPDLKKRVSEALLTFEDLKNEVLSLFVFYDELSEKVMTDLQSAPK